MFLEPDNYLAVHLTMSVFDGNHCFLRAYVLQYNCNLVSARLSQLRFAINRLGNSADLEVLLSLNVLILVAFC